MTLKIRKGRYYLDGNERVQGPAQESESIDYPWFLPDLRAPGCTFTFTDCGKFYIGPPSKSDLVSECTRTGRPIPTKPRPKAKRKGKARGNTVPSNYSFDCWTLRYPDGSYEKSHDQRMHEGGLVAMYGDRDQAERTQRNKLPEHKPEIIRIRFCGRVEILHAPAGKGGGE